MLSAIVCALLIAWRISAQTEIVRSDFEGIYQVGTTTCVVTPAKMTFEVRWHGKIRPEYYFYSEAKSLSGKVVFETDPDYNSGVLQSFVFDSEKLDQGLFLRSDGKKFRVVRKGNVQSEKN